MARTGPRRPALLLPLPADPSQPGEDSPCPGVPFQQTSNFIYGTEDAIELLRLHTGSPRPEPGPRGGSATVNHFNPLWRMFDRSPDRPTRSRPGGTCASALVGHSLGATAVSYVQAVDKRVEAAAALDKLLVPPRLPGFTARRDAGRAVARRAVRVRLQRPALLLAARFLVSPGHPGPPTEAPDPQPRGENRLRRWAKAPASTRCSSYRAPRRTSSTRTSRGVLPASRYGQDLTSVYAQAWLRRSTCSTTRPPTQALRARSLALPRAGRRRSCGDR